MHAREIPAAAGCRFPPVSRAVAAHTHGHTLEAGELADRLQPLNHIEPELAVLPRIVVVEILRRSSVRSAKDRKVFGSGRMKAFAETCRRSLLSTDLLK